jgi:hypothetical protein
LKLEKINYIAPIKTPFMPTNIFEQALVYFQSILAGIVFGLGAVIIFIRVFKRKEKV